LDVRALPRFDRGPAEIRRMAPFHGADNKAILHELGNAPEEVKRMMEKGVLVGT